MTKCEYCGHKFHNVLLRVDCPKCKNNLRRPAETTVSNRSDDGPDLAGFALGYATGIPISPRHGVSGAAMMGAMLHNSQTQAAPPPSPEPSRSETSYSAPDPSPSYSSHSDGGSSGSYSSYDSGSSSSSYDSGSSGGSSSGGD